MALKSDLVATGIDMFPKARSIVTDSQERSVLGQCFRILLRALTNIGANRRVSRLVKLQPFAESHVRLLQRKNSASARVGPQCGLRVAIPASQ
jgi:hypothetical protein